MLHHTLDATRGLRLTLKKSLGVAALLSGICLSQQTLAGDALRFSEGSYRVPPPGAPVTAGFGSLHNASNEPVRIERASSPEFDKVEMHQSIVENDIAKMRKLDGLVVKANSMLKLEHGGYHLMLMGLKQELQPDQTVTVILDTSAGKLQIELAPSAGMGHHMHKDSKKSAGKKHDHDSNSHDGQSSGHESGHNSEHKSD